MERPSNPIVKTEVIQYPSDIPDLESEPIVVKLEYLKKEEYNEGWNARTLKVLRLIQNKCSQSSKRCTWFNELSKTLDRRVLSCGFYEILQLALQDCILIENVNGKIMLKPSHRMYEV